MKLINDPKLTVRYRADSGELSEHGSDRKAMTPPPVNAEVMRALTGVSQKMWPGVPVLPIMETGASDSIYTMMAGIPSYGINGVLIDRDDVRMHGKDERLEGGVLRSRRGVLLPVFEGVDVAGPSLSRLNDGPVRRSQDLGEV